MKTILFIVGARPNFVKISALTRAVASYKNRVRCVLIHTGQHYSDEMSKVFFNEFHMPEPVANLEVGSGDRIVQTHLIMERLEEHLKTIKPDLVVVVGDVNSSIAATLAAIRFGIPVAHVEAGLRSRNWQMPEEINRVMMDHLSSLLFTTESSAASNLRSEGLDMTRVHFTGNVMIDTMNQFEEMAEKSDVLERLGLKPYNYVLSTLHRPENVDNPERFMELFGALCEVQSFIPVVVPLHPRTQEATRRIGVEWNERFSPRAIPPQSYLDFFKLQRYARFIMTDSGGIQEESSVIGVPCLTLRTETERPVTVEYGTCEVVGVHREKIVDAAKRAMRGEWKRRKAVIPMWDGCAANRTIQIMVETLESGRLIPPNALAHYATTPLERETVAPKVDIMQILEREKTF